MTSIFSTRSDREILTQMFPEGSTVTTKVTERRRDVNGNTISSVRVIVPLPFRRGLSENEINQAIAHLTMNKLTKNHKIRGYWGGLGPGQQFTGEFARMLHGSSTALKHQTV